MKNLAIIPARGGSKRIPRKNIKDFLGKPIIAYSIEAALKSGLFEEVMVSTDDNEIAEIAMKYGANVPFFRSQKSSDDYATLSDVIEEVKRNYKESDTIFENICCILPTAPLITADSIKRGYRILIENRGCSVRPVVRYSYPIQRALKLKNGFVEFFNSEFKTTRSQDLEPAYHDAGQFYWGTFELGLKSNNKLGFEIPELYVQDIDNEQDWKIAEFKFINFFQC